MAKPPAIPWVENSRDPWNVSVKVRQALSVTVPYTSSGVDHIFKDLLPTRSMADRPAQVALCHQMLNAMLEGGISLCDAGTGIGKTYAYLAVGTVYHRFRAASGLPVQPILEPVPIG